MLTQSRETGAIPRLMARLFGERAARLSERLQRVHWLSYLLVVSQSVAVILVLGHAELPLLFDASWAIRALACMGVFVLVATVVSADLALLETLRRVPVLARNRQRGQMREHLAYVLFVLAIEASTYAVVLAALDSNPRALITAAPLIPNAGPIFVAQVILRAVLVCWTAVQLVIVRGRLPVLLSTLTATGKEIVGAHVERRLAGLDIAGISLPAGFRVYAAMSKPPRRIRTWWNWWLVERELAAEAEEDRQVANVIGALDELERRRVVVEAVPPVGVRTPALEPPSRPPTGPGSPAARPRERMGRANGSTGDASGDEGTDNVVQMPAVRTARRDTPAATRTRAKNSTSAKARGKATNTPKGPTQAERAAAIRERRLTWMEGQLAADPTIATRELVRRLRVAEHNRSISESTVSELRHVVEARQEARDIPVAIMEEGQAAQ